MNNARTIPIELNPFISQRELFKKMNNTKPDTPQTMSVSFSRINAVPLKCQIEELAALNDSVLAVAFIVSEGDLRSRRDSSSYYLQLINTNSASCIGTIGLPIDYSSHEALTGLIDASAMNEGKTAFTLVVKTPDNYRMDTYSLDLRQSGAGSR